jgi:hypothetical protein
MIRWQAAVGMLRRDTDGPYAPRVRLDELLAQFVNGLHVRFVCVRARAGWRARVSVACALWVTWRLARSCACCSSALAKQVPCRRRTHGRARGCTGVLTRDGTAPAPTWTRGAYTTDWARADETGPQRRAKRQQGSAQHATDDVQQTTRTMQQTPDDAQRATCDRPDRRRTCDAASFETVVMMGGNFSRIDSGVRSQPCAQWP